jgi:hypothetical protein
MTRVCAHCGTEVDDEALFCPTCGQPIDRAAQPELPPAPDWPEEPTREMPLASAAAADAPEAGADGRSEPPADGEPTTSGGQDEVERAAAPPPAVAPPPEPATEAPAEPSEPSEPYEPPAVAVEPPPQEEVPPWRRGAVYRSTTPEPPPAAAVSPAVARPGPIRPEPILRTPATLSGWLVGIGALVAAVAVFLPWIAGGSYTSAWGLASGVNIVMFVVLLAVLAIVFLPHLVPQIPHRDLVFVAIGMVGIGIGLDRFGLPLTGVGATVFLIGALSLAVGALLAELHLDRHLGGPQT